MRRIPICFALLLTMALVTSTEAAPEPTPATAPAALDSLRARSLQGDAEAQKALGDAYAAGNGVEQSDKTAVDWYAKAADHGLASAESALAGMIFNGRAGPVDLKLAEQWLHKAAEQGYAVAQYNLGVLYLDKRDVTDDPLKGQDWIRRAADQGLPVAQYTMGHLYKVGQVRGLKFGEYTTKPTFEWIEKAANQGYVNAQFAAGKLIQIGEYPIPSGLDGQKETEDRNQRVTFWYRKAADNGLAAAQYEYARLLVDQLAIDAPESTLADAVVWFLKAAEQNQAEAQYTLAKIYLGVYSGNVTRDYKKAIAWTSKAAKSGNYDASVLLYAMHDLALGKPDPNANGSDPDEDNFDDDGFGRYGSDSAPKSPEEKRLALAIGKILAEPKSSYFEIRERMAHEFRPKVDYNGLSVPFDENQTATWYRRAAEQGNPRAQYRLAIMFANGLGVSPDDRLALTWFRKSAEAGDAYAQTQLAEFYGQGGSDGKQSKEWYERAARQGHAYAQYALAKSLLMNCPCDKKLAFDWFSKAAENGGADAALIVAEFYSGDYRTDDPHFPPQDVQAARKWYKIAAERGYVAAQLELGNRYFGGKGFEKNIALAIKWWQRASRNVDPEASSSWSTFATVQLGDLYLAGTDVPRDLHQALQWYQIAVEKGDHFKIWFVAEIQSALGEDQQAFTTYEGLAVSDTDEELALWAQKRLGDFYSLGKGTPQNDAIAAVWYAKAAKKGFAEAQYCLGLAYAEGKGVPKDPVMAYFLLTLAVNKPDNQRFSEIFSNRVHIFRLGQKSGFVDPDNQSIDPPGSKDLDALVKTMSADQIAESRALVAEWHKGQPLPSRPK